MDDIIYASVPSLVKAIQNKEISSKEVVQAYLNQIEQVNPDINAVILSTAEQALQQAEQADNDLAKGNSHGPLHGVPVTIKDCIDVQGLPSVAGSLGLKSNIAEETAPCADRLFKAGAILLGKTNQPEFGMAFESDNLVFGRTNNPYDLSKTPGGSSGGEAAIIAAGGSPLGVGSDYAGSLRYPAHCCGIVGLKPTTGTIPRTGHLTWDRIKSPYLSVGPLARYIDDLIYTFPLLVGEDWVDPYILPYSFGDPNAVDLNQLNVAFYTDDGVSKPSNETETLINDVVKALAGNGMMIEQDCPEAQARIYDIYFNLLWQYFGVDATDIFESVGTETISPLVQQLIDMLPSEIPTREQLLELNHELEVFRYDMYPHLAKYDAIICPVNANPAAAHGTTFDGLATFSHTVAYNYTQWPCVVVRAGTTSDGLPIGVQIVARPWREDVALAVAKQIETLFGGWKPPKISDVEQEMD